LSGSSLIRWLEAVKLSHLTRLPHLAAFFTVSLLMLGSFAPPELWSAQIRLPAPTGPFGISRADFHWSDRSRPESLSSGKTDRRELVVRVWYPTDVKATGSSAAYCPDLKALAPLLGPDELSILKGVRTDVVQGAPLPRKQRLFQVILFSHGNETNDWLYTSFLEDLTSHGYIVAAVDHPYDALGVVLSKGRTVKFADDEWSDARNRGPDAVMELYRARVKVRAEDLIYALNRLEELNRSGESDRFRGRLDLRQAGVFGHSIGGVAAAEACHRDKRLKACANMDGVVWGGPFFADSIPKQPFLFLLREKPEPTGEQLRKMSLSPQEWESNHSRIEARRSALLASVKSGSLRVLVKDATHESFSDEAFLLSSAKPAEAEKEVRTIVIVRSFLLAFFDEHLRGIGSNGIERATGSYSQRVDVKKFGATAPD
jgi:pimeloyl-ACP methyl ester carboxylesterase